MRYSSDVNNEFIVYEQHYLTKDTANTLSCGPCLSLHSQYTRYVASDTTVPTFGTAEALRNRERELRSDLSTQLMMYFD